MFNDQISSKAIEDRNKLLGEAGSSVWGSDVEVKPDTSSYTADELRADQRRMLGGKGVKYYYL